MIKKAAFTLEEYVFNRVEINFKPNDISELQIKIDPSGQFKRSEMGSIFMLKFIFTAKTKNSTSPLVLIECNSVFKFDSNIQREEIPSFFYANSIAIIFQYIRAFVSTVTLQANFQPIVLPTMNLSPLEEILKNNTKDSE